MIISWDFQTGGPLGATPPEPDRPAGTLIYLDRPSIAALSSTYSEDGRVVAATYSVKVPYSSNYNTFNGSDTLIRTYDLSGTEGPHCAPKGRIIAPIWTHEKCIRFVIINPGSVAVSEVEFTLKNPPVEVESLPISDKIVGGEGFLFLPSLSRLAFVLEGRIQVWDAKAAKLLLKSELLFSKTYRDHHSIGSFSSDGRFFANADVKGAVRVWKESPAGYVLHQKLQFVALSNLSIQPRLSSSGESIFMSPDRGAFHLWHTRDQVTSIPSVSESSFTLAFSPDERSAAFARLDENVVTIFNLLTGDLELAIDTGMRILCLGMTGSALVVVGNEKIVTWDLPGSDCPFEASMKEGVQIIALDDHRDTLTDMSISPGFSRIAVLSGRHRQMQLDIYDTSTKRYLASKPADNAQWAGFTRDGREVWIASGNDLAKTGWKIVEDSGSGRIKLELQNGIVCPSGVFPWESCHGYEVTGDGWVLSATQKRLLWLPHRWRSGFLQRAWSGQFLGLLHGELSEVVILEFPE